ncbi:metal-dependent hydrolase [Acinetobacter sp. ANC 3882]|uniref:metal-dependent hydrolase n=1 Tax=Acinetobacter sp. ANC 3882 TaxID=2923423 RepID=UPI001F4A9CC9|nr:metal-dependent hydrolase [Acinetobacter sp. ANC 3882]MCH7313114.1 metal-dependent hydrolase [Acinetobacter sp. ANC 3882]
MNNSFVQPMLAARPVKFDFTETPAHWIYGDAFSSHLINGINLILPIGELWFCRVYNKVLPHVTDPKLRADMKGFIGQEAIHSRAHSSAQKFLHQHGFNTKEFEARIDWLFGQLLGESPFGIKTLKIKQLEKIWLVTRVGIIAAIEHFTCILGQWSLDSRGWDKADPVMADLFRWHLAEEVEHRNVAYDLFERLCQTELGFYISRQALMAAVFPLVVYFLIDAGRFLAGQDPDPAARTMARQSVIRLLWKLEKVGQKTDHVPTFSLLLHGTARWIAPRFHPETEGNTQQALDYLSKSAGVLAAQSITSVSGMQHLKH